MATFPNAVQFLKAAIKILLNEVKHPNQFIEFVEYVERQKGNYSKEEEKEFNLFSSLVADTYQFIKQGTTQVGYPCPEDDGIYEPMDIDVSEFAFFFDSLED